MSKSSTKTGGCQCGLIRYAVCGTLADNVNLCHCRMCQKAMGNVFGIFVPFRSEEFSWTRGTPTKFQSSCIASRLFCSNCGTPLAYQSLDEKLIQITVGSLDHPSEMAPTEQIGIESAIVWTKTLSTLPAQATHEQNPESNMTISYQHPDSETTTNDWLHKTKKTK